MAAMKLFFGDTPVGGEVDLAEFEQLKTDVAGKYDKGDESAIPDGKRDYADAAAMEAAVKGNTAEIDDLNQKLDDWLANEKPELIVGLQNLYPKYSDDDAQEALIYDSAAKMGVVVQRNEQAIIDNKNAITAGDLATLQSAKDYADTQDATNLQSAKTYADTKDAETLAAANKHSDDNDAVTLSASKTYTDEKVAAIPGIDGLEQFEAKVDELDKDAIRNWNSAHNMDPGTAAGGVTNVAVLAKLPDTPDPNTLYIITA